MYNLYHKEQSAVAKLKELDALANARSVYENKRGKHYFLTWLVKDEKLTVKYKERIALFIKDVNIFLT